MAKLRFKVNLKGQEEYLIITVEGSEEAVKGFFWGILSLFPAMGLEIMLLEVD